MSSLALAVGGDGFIIGNGGGCAELLLRMSLNRLPTYTTSCRLDPHCAEHAPEQMAALLQLETSLARLELEEQLVFSKDKFEACVRAGGFRHAGICVAKDPNDPHFYIDGNELYAADSTPLVNKKNVVNLLSDLLLAQKNIHPEIRNPLATRLQDIASKSWIESRPYDVDFRTLEVLLTRTVDGTVEDFILGDGKDYYLAADLIKKRHPCQSVTSQLTGIALQAPTWIIAEPQMMAKLRSSAILTCANGNVLKGEIYFEMPLTKAQDAVWRFGDQPKALLHGFEIH